MSNPTPHMPPEKLAERLSVSLRTLERWRVNGEGPRFLRVGPRRVIYPVAEIERWESCRVYASRAAEMSAHPRAA
jgi:predicted DNA-binding transcriptional regulator AlpA